MFGYIRILSMVAAAFGMLVSGSLSHAESLQEAVKYMIETNPDVRAGAYNRLARDQEVRQAFSAYLPSFDVIGGIGYLDANKPVDGSYDPKEITLSLRQNVFTGLATRNEVARQESRVRSSAYRLQSTAENTALRTSEVYLHVLRTQELNKLAEENLAIHERIADQIKLRSESGVDRMADMDQAQSRLKLAKANVVVTQTNLVDALTNYQSVVGHLPVDLIKPESPDAFMPVSMEEAEQIALASHPALKGASADLDARKSQKKVAKAPFWPILDIELDRNWAEETSYSYEDQDDFIAMLRLRYNLFNGWKDKARKVETTHLISEAMETRNQTHRQVVESIRLSWMAYKSVQDRINYLKQREELATATAAAYTKQWNIGKRTLLDVLDSEAERIDSSKDYVTTSYDGMYAQYRIMNSIGKLVHSLDLKWPEEAKVEEDEQEEKQEEPDKT